MPKRPAKPIQYFTCPACGKLTPIKHFSCAAGRLGGQVTGDCKSRGDTSYYQAISAKATQARRKNRKPKATPANPEATP
jgi:hypothetical protein